MHSQDQGRLRAIDPGLVHRQHGIAHSSDQVHEKSVPAYFVEPHGIANLAAKTTPFEARDRVTDAVKGQEYVEIFRIAANASVRLQGKCTRHCVRNMNLFEELEHLVTQASLLLGHWCRPRRGFSYVDAGGFDHAWSSMRYFMNRLWSSSSRVASSLRVRVMREKLCRTSAGRIPRPRECRSRLIGQSGLAAWVCNSERKNE